MKNDQIFRKTYIDELIRLKNTNYIKVITGVRRSGKSTILNQFMLYLKEIGVNENQILSYDFNDLKLAKLNFENLYDKILSEANKNDINYLFLDEIQEIDNFEKCVISLFENKKIKFDIYISGSNSKMFSENLATLFTGRNLTLKVLPFSFKEFFEYYKDNYLEFNTNEYALAMKRNIFDKYSKFGGLPILLNNLQNVKTLEEQLQQILNDTIVKDVKTRYKIRNIGEFQRIAKYILSETGKEISVLNSVNFIKSNEKFKITHQTIDKYLNYLQEALLIYKAEIYNIKGKNLLKTTAKYYSVDTGVKNVQDNFQT
jgi:predicted AAA+ superfamily ATPase